MTEFVFLPGWASRYDVRMGRRKADSLLAQNVSDAEKAYRARLKASPRFCEYFRQSQTEQQ